MRRTISIILLAVLLSNILTGWFFSNYTLQNPVILRSPLVERYPHAKNKEKPHEEASGVHILPSYTPTPTPKKSVSAVTFDGFMTSALAEVPNSQEWQVISNYPYKSLIALIYKHESSFGQNDACRNGRGYNGFGFRESDSYIKEHGPYCYKTFDAVVSDVNTWIEDKVKKGLTLNQINCLYVRGVIAENCNSGYKLVSNK